MSGNAIMAGLLPHLLSEVLRQRGMKAGIS